MKIAFIWMGFDGRYGKWRDGLWKAMQIIAEKHTVNFYDVNNLDAIAQFEPDIVLYWEAPCTMVGADAWFYKKVCALPYKKALLFAGGELRAEWVIDFDLVFVESRINEEDCERQGIPFRRAFGVNDDIFKPEQQPKVFTGMFQATCATWKRQELFAYVLGSEGVLCGRNQEADPYPFIKARELHTLVLPELPMEAVASLINASHFVLNTSAYWGGGQRTTLEAMACGVPPIVMSDSPKNCEFVEESGFGFISVPDVATIKEVVANNISTIDGKKGIEYIKSKWTGKHYAQAILDGISNL